MAVAEHMVSFRNGPQVMVAGLRPSLRGMGYVRGARVRVSDPAGDPAKAAWEFVVPNDEDATLACRDPAPPAWHQPGARVRIEVSAPNAAPVVAAPGQEPPELTDDRPKPGERLRAVKLALEVAVAAVALVSGAIALVWRSR